MIFRTFRLWLLAAALLLAQLGGLLHGLSHTVEDKERPHGVCELCVAYAAFDHATSGTAGQPLPEVQPPVPLAQRVVTPVQVCPPAFRSRAPPQALV